MTEYDLPFLNAVLNGSATVLLVIGYVAIRAKWVRLHKALMLTALAVSATFLASYLYYHFAVRHGTHTDYDAGIGPISQTVYGVILATHTLLAMAVAPLALVTAGLALAGRFHRHRRLARWTLPIWLYVSITGVMVVWMLKDQYPHR